MKGYNIAIDFGNKNIKVATIDNGKVRMFPFSGHGSNEGYIQNIIYYGENEFFLGNIAEQKAMIAKKEGELIYGIKQKLENRSWKQYISNINAEKTIIDIVEDVLKEIVKKVKAKNGNRDIDSCVITVPVNFTELQKERIRKACKKMNLPLIALISEPVAGGLGSTDEDLVELDDDEEKNVIIFDCGGGTLDIALINLCRSEDELVFRVLGSVGMNFGGILINELILEKCVIPKLQDSSILEEKEYRLKVLREIERAKVSCLGSEEEEEYDLLLQDSEFDFKIESTEITLTKDEMENVIKDYDFENSIGSMFDYLLENEGFEKEDIDKVILLGGTSKIICIQNMVKNYFEDDGVLNIDEQDDDKIYYSVAEGAANYLINLLDKNTKLTIENKNPYQLIAEQENGREVMILTKDTAFETETAPKRFKTISDKGEEKEAFLYQKFETFGSDEKLKVAIGKVKCDKDKFDSYIYYSFTVDKYGEIKCKFYNDDNYINESKIILED